MQNSGIGDFHIQEIRQALLTEEYFERDRMFHYWKLQKKFNMPSLFLKMILLISSEWNGNEDIVWALKHRTYAVAYYDLFFSS